MRQIIVTIFFIFFTVSAFSQRKGRIGQLKLVNSRIIKKEKVQEDICGITTSVIRLTVICKTRCQLTCNFGNPSTNVYDTVTNKVYVCYASDTGDVLYKAIVKRVEQFDNRYGSIVKCDNPASEDEGSPFNKSFFVDKSLTIPLVFSAGESEGDYQMFYINKKAYKIILEEGNGLGSLSSFTHQNIIFKP